jgi:hypothetical protein
MEARRERKTRATNRERGREKGKRKRKDKEEGRTETRREEEVRRPGERVRRDGADLWLLREWGREQDRVRARV